jgi:hypothetical protein
LRENNFSYNTALSIIPKLEILDNGGGVASISNNTKIYILLHNYFINNAANSGNILKLIVLDEGGVFDVYKSSIKIY